MYPDKNSLKSKGKQLNHAFYPEFSAGKLAVLQAIANLTQECLEPVKLPYQALMKYTGLSQNTVKRAVTELKEAGYIKVITVDQRIHMCVCRQLTFIVDGSDKFAVLHNLAAAAAGDAKRDAMEKKAMYSDHGFQLAWPYKSFKHIKARYEPYVTDLNDLFNNCCQFDLSRLARNAKLTDIRPFGRDHDWQFDFSELYTLLDPRPENAARIMELFPEGDAFSINRPVIQALWIEYFIFCMALELGVFSTELFNYWLLEKEYGCTPTNVGTFKRAAFRCMRGPIFQVMQDLYDVQTEDSELIKTMKRVYSSFSATHKDADIYSYATKSVVNATKQLLSNPSYANVMLNKYFTNFVEMYVPAQKCYQQAESLTKHSEEWTAGAWGPLLSERGFMNPGRYRTVTPRFCAPLLLFRQLGMMCSLFGLFAAPDPYRQQQALIFNYRVFNDPDNQAHLNMLREILGNDFPFMAQFYIER